MEPTIGVVQEAGIVLGQGLQETRSASFPQGSAWRRTDETREITNTEKIAFKL